MLNPTHPLETYAPLETYYNTHKGLPQRRWELGHGGHTVAKLIYQQQTRPDSLYHTNQTSRCLLSKTQELGHSYYALLQLIKVYIM